MKILFLTNNDVSAPLVEWLRQTEEVQVWQEKITPSDIQLIKPHIAVSYSYQHIIKQDALDILSGRFINLHISLLPYNRGADPNAWSFLDDTPTGVTIHVIDRGLDTGPILYQREVDFDHDHETLGGSYNILQNHIQDLFKINWESIKTWNATPVQQSSDGTYHHSREFAAIKNDLLGSEGWNVKIATFKERYRRFINADVSGANID